ncbi:uncharacterized protein SPPG_09074 [Spizellomyces punctatus DAOM BR117]|uniref:Uncharacterized protein n=1 Tax=Spizellomyces punctatus (strain DAOM BR117) TaxID=645134 RepID=A0A0L0HNH9_SPIPD|nr:uncharacterized protein SPPG_09074 [Spizellomyces punctatus DAOM BR117]KND02505.1 hypothetical protein SPPG_09074 [Spizellomyces punctatus DAOM BR117]|eukprot:XP_016610544.1 hypothetical protein SPPG_09074 [Spizellomyces punctatus DAOM BR117]
MAAAAPYRTFLGQRVWPATILKLYFPFFISGSMAFFLFSFAHTKMMDSPSAKWENIVNNVRRDTARQKLKAAAGEYYEAHK